MSKEKPMGDMSKKELLELIAVEFQESYSLREEIHDLRYRLDCANKAMRLFASANMEGEADA